MATLAKKTDTTLQQDVLRELNWNTRVEETDVGVEVHQGIVTLTGTVSSWPKKLAAQEAAHHVIGVLDVANDIRVKLPGSLERNDTDIARAVRHALEWDVLVPDQRLQSTVTAGIVALEGAVDSWSQKLDAERAVRNLAGVSGVMSCIEVAPPAVALSDVRHSIEQALERHAAHEAKHIDVAVTGGRVVLTGTVSTWAEHKAVVGAVHGTYGVKTIDDRLRTEL